MGAEEKGVFNPYCLAKMYLERCRVFSASCPGSSGQDAFSVFSAHRMVGTRRFKISDLMDLSMNVVKLNCMLTLER